VPATVSYIRQGSPLSSPTESADAEGFDVPPVERQATGMVNVTALRWVGIEPQESSMQTAASTWNSLEIAKLGVAFMTPVLLFAVGLVVTRAARRFESDRWISQKVIERRIELHKEISPKLNDLLCFLLCIGHFREISPPQAVATKRALDRLFHQNEQLFSTSFREHYDAFINSGFQTWNNVGESAKIKASARRLRQEWGVDGWDASWDDYFAPGPWDPRDQKKRYEALMEEFAAELGVVDRSRSA
jgi:hypothetical protein